jgi:signal transduction histidine kinase
MRAKEDSISVEIVEKIEEDVHYTCYFEEIERALINLIDNSFDALREKKEMNSQFAPILKVTLIKNNFNIHVSVEDNGAGIPNEIINKVKEPFFTTKPTGKGTGLGISMINDIVTSQSGEFLIESKLGEYTKMTMIFPLNNRKKEA